MSKQTISSLLLALIIALDSETLPAQDGRDQPNLLDLSLDDLMKFEIDSVYGPSKYEQKVTKAPAAITVVTADEIRRYGYRTLAEILRNVPGFYVTYDRNYSYIGVRGFGRRGDYNGRIMLLVDGHRTNDNIFDEALLGTEFPVDIDLIDRVEVIRGPNSSLYLANAFLGVINVITKPVTKHRDLSASGELGSYGTYKSRLSYGQELRNGLGILLSGSDYRSAGQERLFFKEFDTPATNNGIAENADRDESHQMFAELSYRNFRLEGVYGSREKGIPTASFGTVFDDARARTVDARGYLDLAYDRNFGSDWGFTSHVYYDRGHYDGIYPEAPESVGSAAVLNKDIADGEWWGAEFALSKQLFENHTLILGGDYRDNFRQHQTNYDEQPYYQFFNSSRSYKRWAIYAQDEIYLLRNLTLNVGLRYDRYSTFGGTTNPRGALIYQPFEKTTFKLLYGQSFRAPNAYELYYAGEGQQGNPDLRPETAKTTELVLEQYFPGNLRLLISGYYYPIHNLINQETDSSSGNIVYRNSAQSNLRGVEISLKKKTQGGLDAGMSLSIQDAKETGSQGGMLISPHMLAQGNLSVPLFKRKVYASTTLNFVSRRRAAAGDYAGAYALPGFTLFTPPSRHWEASASLYNAFGSKYGDPGSIGDSQDIIFQDGRTFRLKLTYRF